MSEQLAEDPSNFQTRPVNADNWRNYAECDADTAQSFYAPSHFERKPEKDLREGMARALCRRCIASDFCLTYALDTGQSHGIWGGLNELERKRILLSRIRSNNLPINPSE
jgi:WhiB family redox-sensing transcriptional regulator